VGWVLGGGEMEDNWRTGDGDGGHPGPRAIEMHRGGKGRLGCRLHLHYLHCRRLGGELRAKARSQKLNQKSQTANSSPSPEPPTTTMHMRTRPLARPIPVLVQVKKAAAGYIQHTHAPRAVHFPCLFCTCTCTGHCTLYTVHCP
jgi:hypothetical protein